MVADDSAPKMSRFSSLAAYIRARWPACEDVTSVLLAFQYWCETTSESDINEFAALAEVPRPEQEVAWITALEIWCAAWDAAKQREV